MFNHVAVAARYAQQKHGIQRSVASSRGGRDGVTWGGGAGSGHFPRSTWILLHSIPHSPANRVLIVDWDVHHGQGTQFTFDQDPRYAPSATPDAKTRSHINPLEAQPEVVREGRESIHIHGVCPGTRISAALCLSALLIAV